MDINQQSIELHAQYKGKLEITSKVPIETQQDLSLAYSPGVAGPCMEIQKDVQKAYTYTTKGNMIAIVTDGTAVLGLGDIGPEAALPVMEGKAILLKKFSGVDAVPICLNTKNVDEIIQIIKGISPTFGAIQLEDIAAPRCFEIEEKLQELCDIPVYHDDQHGTAIVVAAALENALKLVKKEKEAIKIVIGGAGASGIAILNLLHFLGYKNIRICDSKGIIYQKRTNGMNEAKRKAAEISNQDNVKGTIHQALIGADVFIGVSVANTLTKEDILAMNQNPIIFALANPNPEIDVAVAKEAGALVVGTGRSDYPNQINNVLAFPGVFRGALDVQASKINMEMKVAAVQAIASLVTKEELSADYIVPKALDERVAKAVAAAVKQAAIDSNVAQI